MPDPWTLVLQGQYEAAVQAYSRLLKAEPSRSFHRSNRGIAYLLLDQPAAALKDFRRVLEAQAPELRSDGAYIQAGICYWLLDRPLDALALWREGLFVPYTDAAGGVVLPALLLYAGNRLGDAATEADAIKRLRTHWKKYLTRQRRRKAQSQPRHDELVHLGLLAWPGPIVPLLLGKMDTQAFLSSVLKTTNEVLRTRWQCGANFYLAVRARRDGDRDGFYAGMRRSASSKRGQLEAEFFLARWEVARGFPEPPFASR